MSTLKSQQCISECSRTEPGGPVHKSTDESYHSGDDFNSLIGIIATINSTVNHSYDCRYDFNSPIEIMLIIN